MDQKQTLITVLALTVNLTLIHPNASAAPVPWIGTANYQAAASSQGDEDIVGLFDRIDFSEGGIALVQQTSGTPGNFAVGDTFMGYYQSYVAGHTLGGVSVTNPNLNSTGSGSGYEVTVQAWFSEEVIALDLLGNPTFGMTGGALQLFFDSTPDYSFSNDAGFGEDDLLLQGAVVGGGGSFVGFLGVGFGSINIDIGNLGFYDKNVFSPDTILAADSVFTLSINEATGSLVNAIRNGSNTVQGNVVGPTDSLLEADGSIRLNAVPIPPAMWLFGTALSGMLLLARRRDPNK
jgi:hypothetical protein